MIQKGLWMAKKHTKWQILWSSFKRPNTTPISRANYPNRASSWQLKTAVQNHGIHFQRTLWAKYLKTSRSKQFSHLWVEVGTRRTSAWPISASARLSLAPSVETPSFLVVNSSISLIWPPNSYIITTTNLTSWNQKIAQTLFLERLDIYRVCWQPNF